MSTLLGNDIKESQTKIKLHIDELEEKVKSSKIYWNNCEYNYCDKNFIQNFIDGHYSEIVHHLNEIKHHLEQISHHKTEIEDIQSHVINSNKQIGQSDSNHTSSTIEQSELTIKRSEEDKIRLRNNRLARSESLKFVLQWEKMMDEQKQENSLTSVKRRFKSGPNLSTDWQEENDVSKMMVKDRVMQFEGIHKPKRASSTIETFLDYSGKTPVRIKSYPIVEEFEDEIDSERERPKSFEFESIHEDDKEDSDGPKKCDDSDDESMVTKCALSDQSKITTGDGDCDTEQVQEDASLDTLEDATFASTEDESPNRTASINSIDDSKDKVKIDSENSTEISTKPKIVEIHIILAMAHTVIHTVNQGLEALRQEIMKFKGNTLSPQYTSICSLLMGNLIVLENIKTNGKKTEQKEAEIVITYLKHLKDLLDSKIIVE